MFLKCNNISFRYPHAETAVFSKMSCKIPCTGFHSLFGPSGVGKTTLIRLISGDLTGFTGKISLPSGTRLLYSYNLERLPGWSTVRDHLHETAAPVKQGMIQELADAFGLSPFMGNRFGNLSLGQQNRVNLTRYLLQDFDILIMDESLANVDETTKGQIILKIKAMFPSCCFIYISHNVSEVARFCDHILVLRQSGRIPQVACARGLDFREGEKQDDTGLTAAMLEIMHAS